MGIVSACIGGKGGVYCKFIINFLFLLFLVFYGGGGLGGEFAISR